MIKAQATFKPRGDLGRFIEVHVTPAVRKSVEEVTQMVFDRSQELVPVDTGELKASGTQSFEELDKTIRGVVDYTAEHAPFVEFGTGIAGAASEGAGEGPYDPSWPGMIAQPYLRPAVDEVRPKAADIFKSNIGVAIA